MPKKRLSPDEDKALLRAWCAGDAAAGDRLIRATIDSVARLVVRKVGHEANAEELVQETFKTTLLRKHDIRDTFWKFAHGVARRKVMEHYRRKGRLADELTSSIIAAGPGPETLMRRKGEEEALEEAMARLSPEDQELIYLHDREGMTAREIAEQYGVTTDAIAGRIRRARNKLRAHVEEIMRRPTLPLAAE